MKRADNKNIRSFTHLKWVIEKKIQKTDVLNSKLLSLVFHKSHVTVVNIADMFLHNTSLWPVVGYAFLLQLMLTTFIAA